MRIQLIAPARVEPLGVQGRASIAPPLSLGILAGLSPAGSEITITDENVSPIDWQKPTDLVAISCTTPTALRAYEIADRFRERGVKVVLGGLHPSALPAEAGQHADAVVVGEAEGQWPRLLADLENGRLRPVYRRDDYPDLADVPLPRRDLFPAGAYVFPDTIYTTRGCPYGCSFCSVTTFFGGTYRSRPVEEVTAEIDAMGRPRIVFFLDDNVAANPGRAKRLFRALAPYKMRWFGQADINVARDEELLALAAASGCVLLLIGIESLSPTNLRTYGKRANKAEEYEAALARIHAHGIAVFGAFLLGLDDDTEDVFETTVRFARRTRLEAAQFNIPAPYPGTPLHAALEREGRILTRNWAEYSSDRVVFEPVGMSARRLQEGHDWIWREFYSMGSVWERIGLAHRDALLMWALNLNFQRGHLARYLLRPLASLAGHVYQRTN